MKRIALIPLLYLSLLLKAQLNIAPIWCFGKNAGLDFRTTIPDTFTSAISSSEGAAGATDENGNIWFYSNGSFVYNRNHQVMPNGFGLTGGSSSSQSAIVLQHPSQRDARQFYVLTTPEFAGTSGFCYSVVDMNQDNGNGDVVQKNIRLYPDVLSEQMQPAMHANGVDYWVVIKGFKNDSLFTYLIDSTGIHLKKRFSFGKGITNTIGCMRFNLDYSRFAYTCYDYTGYVEICDFDNSTGEISNPLLINDLYDPYGVNFSPDGSKLYVGHLQTLKLYQFDLSNYNEAAIAASKYMVATGEAFGQINRAANGKYYEAVLQKNAISEIGNPNALGAACNFMMDKVSTGGKMVVYGLPLFYVFTVPKTSIAIKGKCVEDTVRFSCNLIPGKDVFTWELNTGSGYKVQSNNSFFKYKFSAPGRYMVRIIQVPDTITDTFDIVSCKVDSLQWTLSGKCRRDTFYFSSNLIAGVNAVLWEIDEGNGFYVASTQVSFKKYFHANSQFTVRLIGLNDTLTQTIYLQVCDTLEWSYTGLCFEDDLRATSNLVGGLDSAIWQINYGNGYNTISTQTQLRLQFDSAISFKLRLIGMNDTLERSIALRDCNSACNIKIPNVFTPNDDLLNDQFNYSAPCLLESPELLIYNRWGELLFESHTQGEGWDGRYNSKFCPDGLYLYVLSYTDERKNRIVVNGLIHLIR